jgi:hypothetical protein
VLDDDQDRDENDAEYAERQAESPEPGTPRAPAVLRVKARPAQDACEYFG